MTAEPTSPSKPTEHTEPSEPNENIVDSLTLRFDGVDTDGSALHELRASHVAEVLQGLVGFTDDFDKAGVFDSDVPADSEILVRPAKEGSFEIEVIRVANENAGLIAAVGGVLGFPTIGVLLQWATKSARADVRAIERDPDLDLVRVTWQDDTMNEIPTAAWDELNKRKRRRKKHLRQIMAPLSDTRVHSLDVALTSTADGPDKPEVLVLGRDDYNAVKPEDDIEESHEVFDVEAQMSAIDFDDFKKWKVKTSDETRTAIMDDREFLAQVASGLAIRKEDIFELKIRADKKTKNGSTRTTWTVLRILSHRRAASDNDS